MLTDTDHNRVNIAQRRDMRNPAKRYPVTKEDREDSLIRVVTTIRQSDHPQCITVWQDRTTGLYFTADLSHDLERQAEKHDWRYLGTGADALDNNLLN